MSNLPVSPITGQPSAIRAAVEKTTYLQPPQPPPQAQPQPQLQAPDISRAVNELARVVHKATLLIDRVAQQQQQQRQRPMVTQSQASISPPHTWGHPQPLPTPKTGPVGQGYPDQAWVIRHGATSPGGMAAAQVAGPDPTLTLARPGRKGYPVRALVRASLGLRY